MTDLILTEDTKQYQDLARDFSQNEIAPRAEKFDHTGELPQEICKKAWEIGLVNVRVPEEFGGLGLGLLDACVIAEELGAGCAGITAAIWGNDLAVAPLMVAGNKQQQERWLTPLLSEFKLAGYCLDETNSLTAKSTGNAAFTISGEATCINATTAGWIFLTAETSGGRTAFIIEAKTSGIKVAEPTARIGLKAADMHTVNFDQVAVTAENLIGEVDKAEQIMQSVRVYTAALMAAYATGVARAALENAIKYSKERQTFGVPIGNHQAVGFMLADIAKNTDSSRLLTHKAAWMADHGDGCAIQSTAARHFATESAMQSATDAVQVYGGYGYSREYPVEKLMRDVKTLQVLDETPHATRVQHGRALIASVAK